MLVSDRGINFMSNLVKALCELFQTRTVRKSDYTSALALPKHMAGILDENAERKKNTGNNK